MVTLKYKTITGRESALEALADSYGAYSSIVGGTEGATKTVQFEGFKDEAAEAEFESRAKSLLGIS